MRRLTIALPLLLLAACNVTSDEANDQVSVEYDQNLAEESAETVVNEAERIGGYIANDVEEAGRRADETLFVEDDAAGNAQAE